jgi:hypothetical protein
VQSRLEELVAEWEPRTTAKQRLTGVRLHRALLEEGYQVGLTTIHQYLRERRRQRAEVYVPLIHRVGDEAQIGFFEVTVELDGQWHKALQFRVLFQTCEKPTKLMACLPTNGVTDT